jgi:hypothetical protein
MCLQPVGTLEKSKEKVNSSKRVQGKGFGACNAKKANPNNHLHSAKKNYQGDYSKPHVGYSYE